MKTSTKPVAWILTCASFGGGINKVLSWTQNGTFGCNRLLGDSNEQALYTVVTPDSKIFEHFVISLKELVFAFESGDVDRIRIKTNQAKRVLALLDDEGELE